MASLEHKVWREEGQGHCLVEPHDCIESWTGFLHERTVAGHLGSLRTTLEPYHKFRWHCLFVAWLWVYLKCCCDSDSTKVATIQQGSHVVGQNAAPHCRVPGKGSELFFFCWISHCQLCELRRPGFGSLRSAMSVRAGQSALEPRASSCKAATKKLDCAPIASCKERCRHVSALYESQSQFSTHSRFTGITN